MRFIRKHIRQSWPVLLLAMFFAGIHRIAAFTEPYIFKLIIDDQIGTMNDIIPENGASRIGLWLLLALGVATLSRLASNVEGYFVVKLVKNIGKKIYLDGIEHCLSISTLDLEKHTTPELIAKLQTAKGNIERFISELIIAQFGLLISVVAVIVYSFQIYWMIAPVVFISTPLVGLFVSRMSKNAKGIHQEYFKQTNHLVGVSNETFRNIQIVKSLGLERQELSKLAAILQNTLRIDLTKVKKVNTVIFSQNSVVNIIRNGMLFWVLFLVSKGEISVGDFFSLLMCSYLLLQPLQQAGTIVNTYRETRASLEFLEELHSIASERIENGSPVDTPIDSIRFSSVSFTYRDSKASIQDISFVVNKGETLGIVGASGAGKSTIIKLILGLYRSHDGEVLFNEKNIKSLDMESLRRRVGYVTQEQLFFSASIRDNMRFVKSDCTDAEILEAMNLAECEYLALRTSEGLDTRLGEAGLTLSGGERQRLAIARALIRKPWLLVLDEATSSLDVATEQKISQTIKQIVKHGNFITIIVSHRLPMLAFADSIIVMEKGEVVNVVDHDQLCSMSEVYSKGDASP